MRRPIGFVIVELIAAAAIVAVLLSVTLELFRVSMTQQRLAAHRQAALQEAANLMERLASQPWDDLTTEGVKGLRLSDETSRAVPDATLAIEIGQPQGEPAAKQITVNINLNELPGVPARPMQLVAWKHRQPKTP
jgi:Tfp pilus assembly protein PilE